VQKPYELAFHLAAPGEALRRARRMARSGGCAPADLWFPRKLEIGHRRCPAAVGFMGAAGTDVDGMAAEADRRLSAQELVWALPTLDGVLALGPGLV